MDYSSGKLFLFGALLVLAAATAEGLIRAYALRAPYDWRGYFASVGIFIGRRLIDTLPLGLAISAYGWVWEHRLFTVPIATWWGIALLFLGQEFCYYWMHRADHEIRWFWVNHSVHHSPNRINFSTAFRLGWTGQISGQMAFFLPLMWLGFPPQAVLAMFGLNLLYQFWIHAEWIPKLGPLEWVLNTPSHHRVHHASNVEYLDANYGGVLIVFDRLFGTFIEERADLPCRYGLVKPLNSFNPLVIAFHEWGNMIRDVVNAPTWHARLMHVVGRPGWRPNGQSETTADMRRRAAAAADAAASAQPASA